MVCDICETRAKATETLTVNKVWHKATRKSRTKATVKKTLNILWGWVRYTLYSHNYTIYNKLLCNLR